MKNKLVETIREVPIADKTYSEYVEALADKLITEDYRKIFDDHQRQCTCYALGCQMAEELKSKVAREIFEEIEDGIKSAVSALQFENNPIHRKVKHETYSSLMRFVKTIEKKYTESEKEE